MLINSQLTLKAPLTFLSKAENNLLKHLKKPPAKFDKNKWKTKILLHP